MKVQHSALELNQSSNIPLQDDIGLAMMRVQKRVRHQGKETSTNHDSNIKDNLKGDEVMEVE